MLVHADDRHTARRSGTVTANVAVRTPSATVQSAPILRQGLYLRYGKRPFDVVVASLLLVVAAPVMAVVWVVLRKALGPGVVISPARVGLHGENFEMLKFRTMKQSRRRNDATFDGTDRRRTHKADSDPRHTRIGRALRKASIDELPQLINVLRGEMSLVGPRPELAMIVDRYQLRDHVRHQVRPGVTGDWQVTVRQDGALLHESFDCDNAYLGEVGFFRDLSVLIRTVGVVLRAGGR